MILDKNKLNELAEKIKAQKDSTRVNYSYYLEFLDYVSKEALDFYFKEIDKGTEMSYSLSIDAVLNDYDIPEIIQYHIKQDLMKEGVKC